MKLGGKIIDRGLHGLNLCLRLDQFLFLRLQHGLGGRLPGRQLVDLTLLAEQVLVEVS